uniref:ATP synthase complex subunit 8 n=1 Tax=Dactyloptena orientalis TaxID=390316 RepID=A0A060NQ89_9TELE|nr:ATP synthase F0 subunit 8 [Dactyloptena orientalis]BAO84736.1 ATPase subunit 8 [Dactyloptena orientalis]
MPQLNPSPWFLILIFSWLVFLTIIPPKMLSHNLLNHPNPSDSVSYSAEPWHWPWP